MDLRKAARDPWVWGQLALFVAVLAGLPALVAAGTLGGRLEGTWRVVAATVACLGGVVLGWGFQSLGPNLTPGTEPLPQGRLVATGAYAWVRHPVYLGLVLFLAGWAGWIGNPWHALLTGAVSLGYFDRKAATEERWMTSRFPGYAAYCQAVGKWLPRLPQAGP